MSQARYGVAPSVNLARTKFKTKYDLETTFLHGKLIPLDMIPVIPGSSFKVDLTSYIRMSDPIVPIFGNITVGVHAFFVPWRLLWTHTEEFFGANKNAAGPQKTDYYIPQNRFGSIAPQTVADYLGYPLISSGYYTANVLKLRAYMLIWNEWYRPQQVAEPFIIGSGDADGSGYSIGTRDSVTITTSMNPIEVAKNFDIFTASTLAPQYGDPVEISLLEPAQGNVYFDSSAFDEGVSLDNPLPRFRYLDSSNEYDGPSAIGSEATSGGDSQEAAVTSYNYGVTSGDDVESHGFIAEDGADYSTAAGYDPAGTLKVNISNAVMTDVRTLRFAFAMQRYLEALNFGSRYFEILQNIYGTTNPDARLQRPEHIGQIHFPIQIQQVLSTAGAESGATSKLGQAGANSVTLNRNVLCSKGFTEFGYLCIMLDTKHDRVYSQGLKREDYIKDRFDIYAPQFDHVGDFSVLNKELFIQSEAGINSNGSVFGYQEGWYSERYREPRVSGLLNPNATGMIAPYSLAEAWDNRPSLSWEFLMEDRENIKRVLKTGNSGPDYLANFHIELTMIKPMSAHSLPGLIDHVGRM